MENDSMQGAQRKPAHSASESVRDYISQSKRHRSPATLFPVEREGIVAELRNGRSVEQAARAYHAQPHVALELWLRRLDQRLTAMERETWRSRLA